MKKLTIKIQLHIYLSCLIAISLLFFSSTANAQVSNQSIINQQDWITGQQQKTLEEQNRDKELETIKKERKRRKKEQEEEEQKSKLEEARKAKPAQCFMINQIKLNDAKALNRLSLITSNKKENNMIYFEVSTRIF